MTLRFDRRRFLFGAGGAMLALPMLESLAPRAARAGGGAPPKRLVVFTTSQGRLFGDGLTPDWWSPRQDTGPLPAAGIAPSAMLAALAPIRDEIVTIDGIDNLLRHVSNMEDGHIPAIVSALTCMPQYQQEWRSTGPSIDYVAGLRLRASEAMRPSIIVPASATPEADWSLGTEHYAGVDGTPATVVSGNPEYAVETIFGPPMPTKDPVDPLPLTLRDRMAARRVDLLSGVREQLSSLRGRVSQLDRERLDQHAAFIESTQAILGGGGGGMPLATCMRPDETMMPHVVPSDYGEFKQTGQVAAWQRGRSDAVTWPHQLENIVQALACDVVRVVGVATHSDPVWSSEFDASPFESDSALHNGVHGLGQVSNDPQLAQDISTGFQADARKFADLVARLAEFEDTDGSRLLDNTLVVWVSEMGYGAVHGAYNIPVVLAGLGGAFSQGQGRHVVHANRRTMGDLWAHVLRMLGGTDETFGETGTLGQVAAAYGVGNLVLDAGAPGLGGDWNLHAGELDL